MVVHDLDDVQYDLEVDGEEARRQLAREVWEQRGWATVVIHFIERARDGSWKDAKVAILRFKRKHDAWKKQATITLALADAQALAAVIASWSAPAE